MKKYLTPILISMIFLSNNVKAQNINTSVFTIDLAIPTKNSVNVETPRVRLRANSKEPIVFRLKNGNPFKYKYVINSNVVNLFENTSADPIGDLYDKMKDNAKDVTKSSPADTSPALNNALSIQQNIVELNTGLNKAKLSLANANKNNKSAFSKANVEKEQNKVSQLEKAIAQNKTLLANINVSAANKYNRINNFLNNSILKNTAFTTSVTVLNVDQASGSTEESVKNNYLNSASVLLQDVYKVQLDIKEYNLQVLQEDFLDSKDYIIKKNEFLKRLISEQKTFNDLSNNIEQESASNETLTKKINAIQESLAKIFTELSTLSNVRLEYYTMPIDINGKNIDLLKITVERRDKKTDALLNKNDYQIWIGGGFKIDISAGLFISSLKDDNFFTIDSTTSLKKIYKSDKGKYGLGFGSMLNISYRTGAAWIKPALSFGAMVSEAQKFQGLAGISLMLGKEERAVLHWGVGFGSVDRLESSYTTFDSSSKVYSLGASNQVPITQRFSFGNFFGFTYNISGTKAKVPSIASAP